MSTNNAGNDFLETCRTFVQGVADFLEQAQKQAGGEPQEAGLVEDCELMNSIQAQQERNKNRIDRLDDRLHEYQLQTMADLAHLRELRSLEKETQNKYLDWQRRELKRLEQDLKRHFEVKLQEVSARLLATISSQQAEIERLNRCVASLALAISPQEDEGD